MTVTPPNRRRSERQVNIETAAAVTIFTTAAGVIITLLATGTISGPTAEECIRLLQELRYQLGTPR